MIKYKHVEGREDSKVVLFTLSTCGWCKKMKSLLNELCIAYDYVDMDQLDAEDVDNAKIILKKWNPTLSFPTMVIDNETCIIGYKEDEIRDRLGK